MKKKLLILIDTLYPKVDGVAVFLHRTVPLLSKKYDITIIAPNYGNPSYENVKLIKMPVFMFGNSQYGLPRPKRKIIKKEVKKCDFILNHESIFPFSSSFYAIKYAKKYNKPLFNYTHTLDWDLIKNVSDLPKFIGRITSIVLKVYYKGFMSKSDLIIVPFKTIKEILIMNGIKNQYEIAPVGVANEFKPNKSINDDKKITLGYSGRFSNEKGIITIIKCFKELEKKYNNLQLIMIGCGPLDDKIPKQKNIIKTGFVDQKDVIKFLQKIDIFLLPSKMETSSIATMEAMKTGAVCVARDVGCISDYLKNDFNGFLFEKNEELLPLLEKLIDNKDLREKFSKNGRKIMLEYNWENTTNKLIEIFEKYLN